MELAGTGSKQANLNAAYFFRLIFELWNSLQPPQAAVRDGIDDRKPASSPAPAARVSSSTAASFVAALASQMDAAIHDDDSDEAWAADLRDNASEQSSISVSGSVRLLLGSED